MGMVNLWHSKIQNIESLPVKEQEQILMALDLMLKGASVK